MNDLFYRAFEDRHRGSRELIKDRLRAYLPFLQPLVSALAPARALDLGCGRGEWLELLGEQGFKAHGVDLDEGMLAACRERNLDVATQDALSSLRDQPDASLALVSSFHLVEHIDFDDVQTLIVEALRVLQPGGLLIMETPNPENLVVATSGFYMDPSHLRPIPPQLLEFVVDFHGFARHRVVRLQEPGHLAEPAGVALLNVINAVSPDYSVVAQKDAPLPVAQQFDHAFSVPFGLTLDSLADRYDAQRNAAQQALQHDMYVLGERVRVAEQGSAELFKSTIDTIHAAQAAAQALQQELDRTRQRERHLEEHAKVLALKSAEERVVHSHLQADIATQRLQVAEQRAVQAEQIAERLANETESAAREHAKRLLDLAQRKVDDAEQLAAEAALQAEDAERHAAEAEQRARAAERIAETTLQLRQQLSQNNAEMQQLRSHLRDVQAHANGMEQQITAMYASSSWRMTKPVRAAKAILQKASNRGAGPAPAQAGPAVPAATSAQPTAAPAVLPTPVQAGATVAPGAMSPEAEKVFQQLLRSAQPDQTDK